jgi:malate dehydrogenase (oxaloacetate-decarboxylating)(NADP+)
MLDEGIGKPILLGRIERIEGAARELGLSLEGMELVEPRTDVRMASYAQSYQALRERKGVTRDDALRVLSRRRTYFGMMMVRHDHADVVVSGLTLRYPEIIVPALECIGVKEGVKRAAGVHLVINDQAVRLLTDTVLNIDPNAETLAEIALQAADVATQLGLTPSVAMLSFSTYGSASAASSRKMAEATRIAKQRRPELNIDGEVQADVALSEALRERYPFSTLKGPANVLVFPNLDAGNIGYKLCQLGSGADVIGPIMVGMNKPVALLTPGNTVDDIVHLTTIAASRAIAGAQVGSVREFAPEKPANGARERGLPAGY